MTRIETSDPAVAEVVLLTGFPRDLAERVRREILAHDEDARIIALVPSKQARALRDERVSTVTGDVAAMDMALSGDEFHTLTETLTTIHHMARAPWSESDRSHIERVHVGGTRSVLQLASECKKLRRLCHWSSVIVAGKRKGVVLEEELDEGQSFHNAHEQTLFEAEKLARAAMRKLPVTVLRPSTVVGDSPTGRAQDQGGPHQLLSLLVNGNHGFPMPIPGHSNAPLHLAPMEFVARAGHRLGLDARAAGRTFHLCDPNPLSARKVFELVAEHAHAKLARRSLPTGIAKTLLKAPGIERLARTPRAFLDTVDQQVFFNSRHADQLLRVHGISCPSFDSYVEGLVESIRKAHLGRGPRDDDEPATVDPFDS